MSVEVSPDVYLVKVTASVFKVMVRRDIEILLMVAPAPVWVGEQLFYVNDDEPFRR